MNGFDDCGLASMGLFAGHDGNGCFEGGPETAWTGNHTFDAILIGTGQPQLFFFSPLGSFLLVAAYHFHRKSRPCLWD